MAFLYLREIANFIVLYRHFGTRWLLKRMGIFPGAYYNYLKQTKAAYHAKKVRFAVKSRISIMNSAESLAIGVCVFFLQEIGYF